MSNRKISIEGTCDSKYSAVQDEFYGNFSNRDEIGSSVCIYQDGERVVDLWGGYRDREGTQPWTEDTITLMSSVAKSICALSIHLLVERGLVSLDVPVATYWPEFSQNGKESILLNHTMSHQCGIIYCDHAKTGDFFNYPAQIAAIELQKPAWPAGTQGAYNSINFGFIHGEVVRRITGKTVDKFIRAEITEPLHAEYNIGLNGRELTLVAPMHRNQKNTFWKMGETEGSRLNRIWSSLPRNIDLLNAHENRVGLNPSSGGHGNARGIAKIYAMLANNGEIGGLRLFRPETVKKLSKIQWEGVCGTTNTPRRFGLGFLHNCPPSVPMGTNMKAFGHPGSGGALGFCDIENNRSFGFCTNFQPAGQSPGIRCRSLVDAAFGKAPDWKP